MMVRTLGVALFLFAGACASAPPGTADTEAIRVDARPVALNPEDPAAQRVGHLRYMGGLQLQSRDSRFGGLSGLRWNGGRLYAVSDAGDWFAIDLREIGGRLSGVGTVRIKRLTDLNGGVLQDKTRGDAEALNLNMGGCVRDDCVPASVDVAFEQDHRIWTYALKDGMPDGPPVQRTVPPDWLRTLPANGGMEAMAGHAHELLVLSEKQRTASGTGTGLLFHTAEKARARSSRWDRIELAAADDFSPTDADALGDGRFLILYRRYSLMRGVAARLGLAQLNVGADGRPQIMVRQLAELTPPLSVDNMEGLAVRREGGRLFVYLVSDDNFSGAQRTLLMKFELPEQVQP